MNLVKELLPTDEQEQITFLNRQDSNGNTVLHHLLKNINDYERNKK